MLARTLSVVMVLAAGCSAEGDGPLADAAIMRMDGGITAMVDDAALDPAMLPRTDLPAQLQGVWVRADNPSDRMRITEADGEIELQALQTGLFVRAVRIGQVLRPRSKRVDLEVNASAQGLILTTGSRSYLFRAEVN
jgi:hypothetical protein